jgi:hypothetical protein
MHLERIIRHLFQNQSEIIYPGHQLYNKATLDNKFIPFRCLIQAKIFICWSKIFVNNVRIQDMTDEVRNFFKL